MSTRDDGGPAFPIPGLSNDADFNGMSLRDYAAIHSTQPGCSEIVAMAGLVWSAAKVWTSETVGMTFDQWWETMPLAERLDLCAKVRYAQADAMLAARRKP